MAFEIFFCYFKRFNTFLGTTSSLVFFSNFNVFIVFVFVSLYFSFVLLLFQRVVCLKDRLLCSLIQAII